MKDIRYLWQRERAPSCEGLVCLLGVAACAVGFALGLKFLQYFFAIAMGGGLLFAGVSYMARR